MKKVRVILPILLVFTIIFNSNNIIYESDRYEINNINYKSENNIDEYKRNYNYIEYSNESISVISNKKDIKNSIYNALNNGKDKYTIYCNYNNYIDCLNDFKEVFYNKELMSSISNYVNPFNRYKSIKYNFIKDINIYKIELTITKKYNDEQINEINNVIDKYISNSNINNLNDKDKIKLLHNYLINKNSYDKKAENNNLSDSNSAYGAIVKNKALCQGYSEAMAILLDRFNIPNILITSKDHIWNLVYIDNEWKHLDVTWDDPITVSGNNKLIYDYYLINNNKLSKLDNSSNHKYYKDFYLEVFN